MNRLTFYIVVGLCVLYAGLNVGETYMYQTWVRASTEQRAIAEKAALSDRVHTFTGQFLRRLTVDSQGDPVLLELLKKHLVRVPDKNKSKASLPAKANGAGTSPTNSP